MRTGVVKEILDGELMPVTRKADLPPVGLGVTLGDGEPKEYDTPPPDLLATEPSEEHPIGSEKIG